jgi:hypothetical protein
VRGTTENLNPLRQKEANAVRNPLIIPVAAWAVALLVVAFMTSVQTPLTRAATCNEGVSTAGRLAPGQTTEYQALFCSDPTDSLVGLVTWGKRYRPDQDLAVVVTSPSGLRFVFDDGPSSAQSFIVFGPLEEGMWGVTVANTGTRAVRYDLQWGFG